VTVEGADLVFVPDGHLYESARPVRSPVTVTNVYLALQSAAWGDAPDAVSLQPSDERTFVSWTGSGTVSVPGRPPSAGRHIGLSGDHIAAEVRRIPQGAAITGRAHVHQLYVNGVPQLPTTAEVIVKHAPRMYSLHSGAFSWAPTNRGATDLVITGIAPASDAARWVELGLEPVPALCGDPDYRCPFRAIGGDTSGFQGGDPITSVIRPYAGDEREITFNVPPGTPPGAYRLAFEFRGNFRTFVFAVTVNVPPT
jgi:hypothetical protein